MRVLLFSLVIAMGLCACGGGNGDANDLSGSNDGATDSATNGSGDSNGAVTTQSAGNGVRVAALLPEGIAFDRLQNLGASVAVDGQTYRLIDEGYRFHDVIELAPESSNTWSAQLYEIYNGEWITLAHANGTFSDGAIEITADQWNFSVDDDGDTYNNLEERIAGASPFDPVSSVSNPNGQGSENATTTELRVLVDLPDLVEGVNISSWVRVTVGDQQQGTLNLNGRQYTTLFVELEPRRNYPVSVEVMAYVGTPSAEGPNAITVAEMQSTLWMAAGRNSFRVRADEFSTDLDNDSDGLTNLQEYTVARYSSEGVVPAVISQLSAEDAPIMDGSLSDTLWLSRFSASGGVAIGRASIFIVDTPENNFTGDDLPQWSAVHDGEYLYLAVRVMDDQIINDSDPQLWHDDSIELFFDGDNSRSVEYDQLDDLQLVFTNGSVVVSGVNSNSIPADIDYVISAEKFQSDIGSGLYSGASGGYNLELRVPLAQIGFTIGNLSGFNVQVNDDDNGGVRDAKVSWVGISNRDRSWRSPRFFGAVRVE